MASGGRNQPDVDLLAMAYLNMRQSFADKDVRSAENDGIGVWFPAVEAGTGSDVFTRRLCEGLNTRGIRAEITWLPHRAEYLPWTVPIPKLPAWATVVHVNTWLHPRFVPSHLPLVATLHHSVHDPALRPYKGWLRAVYHRWWIAPIERRVIRRARVVAAVSRFAAEMARATLSDMPMQVVYNGIDTARFQSADSRQPHTPFRLLFVGSWMARKGVDLLAPIMCELGDDFVLYYTGGPAADKDKRSMPANMVDIGRLNGDQVVAAMQQADAFLFPSRSEGLPLAPVEAMACGLPVIAGNGSSLPEVVKNGVNGCVCPADDVPAFVTAARCMAMDSDDLARMSANARQMARDRFSIEAMVNEYVGLYREALRLR